LIIKLHFVVVFGLVLGVLFFLSCHIFMMPSLAFQFWIAWRGL
jgi:hypothetical protein